MFERKAHIFGIAVMPFLGYFHRFHRCLQRLQDELAAVDEQRVGSGGELPTRFSVEMGKNLFGLRRIEAVRRQPFMEERLGRRLLL